MKQRIAILLALAFLTAGPLRAQILGGDPKMEVAQGMRQLLTTPYRMKIEHLSTAMGKDMKMTTVVEYVPPDRRHIVNQSSMGTMEILKIGPKTYMKGPDGKWTAMNLHEGKSHSGEQISDQILKDIESGKFQVKKLGSEIVGGAPTDIYEVTGVFTFDKVQMNGKNKLWLRAGDRLPLKQESEGQMSVPKPMTFKTKQTYEYPGDLKINAPL